MRKMQRKFSFITALAVMCATLFFPSVTFAEKVVIDISYDKCDGSGTASWVGHHEYGIVGVNGGGDWEENPCLASEVKHFDGYYLYVNTNYPSDGCHKTPSRRAAYDCGYHLGKWDVNYADNHGAHSSTWFLDVETLNTWSDHKSFNASFIHGLAKGLKASGVSYIGYYSTGSQWRDITGGWPGNGWDWYATAKHGEPNKHQVKSYCSANFSGGTVVLYQYIKDGLDHSKFCPR